MGHTEKLGGEVTHLRSRGIIFQGLLCTVGGCQAAALDGEVAVATVDGEKGGGVEGLPVQMPADRPPCLRDTRAAGASDSSLHHPLQLPLPSRCHL